MQFQDDSGAITTLDSADTSVHDLKDYASGSLVTLLSGEAIPSGRYTGVALIFDPATAQIVTAGGTTYPISIPAGPVFAATDVSVLRKDTANLCLSLERGGLRVDRRRRRAARRIHARRGR